MISFPVLKLPEVFVELTKSVNHGDKSSIMNVMDFINREDALKSVIRNCFAEFDEKKLISNIIGTLGWKHFRDRLSSIFIYKEVFGSYPSATDINIIGNIQEFEARFENITVNSNSRLYLLGFYLKLVESYQREEGEEINLFDELLDLEEVIHYSNARSQKADWLLIATWHMVEYIGTKKFQELYSEGEATIEYMMELITEEQKKQFINNCLSYGASIYDQDFFVFKRV